jgi:hypothetical protein
MGIYTTDSKTHNVPAVHSEILTRGYTFFPTVHLPSSLIFNDSHVAHVQRVSRNKQPDLIAMHITDKQGTAYRFVSIMFCLFI